MTPVIANIYEEDCFCQFCARFLLRTLVINDTAVAQKHREPVCDKFAEVRSKAELLNAAAIEVSVRGGFTLLIGF